MAGDRQLKKESIRVIKMRTAEDGGRRIYTSEKDLRSVGFINSVEKVRAERDTGRGGSFSYLHLKNGFNL